MKGVKCIKVYGIVNFAEKNIFRKNEKQNKMVLFYLLCDQATNIIVNGT